MNPSVSQAYGAPRGPVPAMPTGAPKSSNPPGTTLFPPGEAADAKRAVETRAERSWLRSTQDYRVAIRALGRAGELEAHELLQAGEKGRMEELVRAKRAVRFKRAHAANPLRRQRAHDELEPSIATDMCVRGQGKARPAHPRTPPNTT